MLVLAWRGVRQHAVRFLLSALAVVLGVAFVTGTLALRTSLSSTFDDITDGSYSADLYVRPAMTDASAAASVMPPASGIPLDDVERIGEVAGVADAAAELEGSGVLVGSDGAPVTGGGAPTIVLPADDDMSFGDGRAPREAGEIAVETSGLGRSGLTVGDRTSLVLSGGVKEVTIVGRYEYDAAVFGATIVVVDEQTALAAFAPDGEAPRVSVEAGATAEIDRLARKIADALGDDVTALAGDHAGDGYTATDAEGRGIEVRAGASLRAELTESIDDVIGFISVLLIAFAAIALFVGAFIISNTFTMSVRQRMREIGVLRALGASPRQVFWEVVGQAVIVGLVGAVLGIAAGMGLIWLVQSVFAAMGSELSSASTLTTETVVIALVTGVSVSALAAAIPARRAASIPPVQAMVEVVRSESSTRLRGIVGAIVLVAGLAAAFAGWLRGEGGELLLGAGAAGALVGALLVAPAVLPFAAAITGAPFSRITRPLGTLAVGNVRRSPRRSASTAGALMIGMALVAACAVLAASVQSSLAAIVTTQARADVMIQNAQQEVLGVPPEAVAAIEGLPEAGRIDTLYFAMASVAAEPVPVVGLSPGTVEHSLALPMRSGSAEALGAGDVVVGEDYADDEELGTGDSVTATGRDAAGEAVTLTLTVTGIMSRDSFIGAPVVLSQADFETLVAPGARVTDMLMLTASDSSDAAELRAAAREVVEPYYVLDVMDRDDLVGSMSQQVQQVLLLLYALLALSIVIAVLGIVNTLALSVIERTREIGLMRAIGLGRAQLAGVVLLESTHLAVFGGLVGLVLGTLVASMLPRVLASRGFDQLAIPWDQLLAMLALSAVVGVVAAVWPAVRAARLPVLRSIATE